MTVITYEDKMKWLNYHLERLKDHQCKSTLDFEITQKKIDIIECIMEDVRDMHIINEEAVKFNKIEKQAEDIYGELFLKEKGDED